MNFISGIVGLGRIGQTVQKMLQPFGVQKFVYTGRHKLSEDLENGAEYKPFEDLLKMSDFVIVTCALTPDTKEIFNKKAFEIMKPTSVFINTSRGGKVVPGHRVEIQEFFCLSDLREMNFGESRSFKTAVFAILLALKTTNLVNFSIQKVLELIKKKTTHTHNL